MAQQISREEWERKYGRGAIERPQPARIPGLPDPEEVIAEIAYLNQMQDAQAPDNPGRRVEFAQRFGENDANTYARYSRGRVGESRDLDEVQFQRRLQREMTRQSLLDAPLDEFIAAVSATQGAPVEPKVAELAQVLLQLPGNEPIGPNAAIRAARDMLAAQATSLEGGRGSRLSRAHLSAVRERAAQIAGILGERGEIGPDVGLQQVMVAANRGLIDPAQPIEAQIAALSPEEAAELELRARSLTKLQQLSAEETTDAADYLGAGKTRGGRRNPFRKEKGGSEEAQVLRVPGNVLSAGMEFAPDDVLLPILVAPKNQQVWAAGGGRDAAYSDASGPAMQLAQYYAGKDERGKAMFAPSLRDARVLYVNPYAELPAAVVERVGLDQVLVPAEKDVSGAYDQDALNVPIPDTGEARNVLPPKFDPGFRNEVAPVYRNPTFAEAVNSLSLKYRTPIKSFTQDMLARGGSGYQDFLVDQPDVQVFALGSKRDEYGNPLPISAYFEQPSDPSAPPVASVRVGSGQKRQVEFYEALDDLVDALAGDTYGRAPAALEVSTGDRFSPAAASSLDGETRYGMLMNLRQSNPIVSAYQRRLLEEAGFPLTGKGQDDPGKNPLIGIVDTLEQLAGAPPSDTPLISVARSAVDAEPFVAPSGQTGAARLLARAKEPLVRGAAGRRATTDRSRQGAERAAAELLRRLTVSPTAAQPREEQVSPFGIGQARERFRQPLIPGVADAFESFGYKADPADDVARYMGARASRQAPGQPERAIQYVMPELYRQFWPQGAPRAEEAPLQQRAAQALIRQPDRQLELPLDLPYSATGFTPDPADAVGSYMARRAQEMGGMGTTKGAEFAAPGQPRIPEMVQTSLALRQAAKRQQDQVISEQASARPQIGATQTVENSPLNAPPPPQTSPAAQADNLLRRFVRGRAA